MIPMMTMKMTMMGVMMKMRRWSLSKHLLCILHLHPKFLVWKIISYKNTLSIVLLLIFTQIMWVNWFRTANLIMWGVCILLSFKVEFLNVFSGCLMLAFPPLILIIPKHPAIILFCLRFVVWDIEWQGVSGS